jgi:hypothetical protein
MSAKKTEASGWPVKAVGPPKLSVKEWVLVAVPGLVLLATAVLQLISFNEFKDALGSMGLPGPRAWAVAIILAELWGAAGFFRLRLSVGFRLVSYTMALAACLFWFIENLQLISNGMNEQLDNSGFFGRFLAQQPGWWTALEVVVLLFWVIYAIELLLSRRQTP